MNARYVERATCNHSRRRGLGSEAFDRFMDRRERRSNAHGLSTPFQYGMGEPAEIERRSLLDVVAPTRR